MTDIPILMNTPMVRALLDGRKTQTRRLAWRSSNAKRLPEVPRDVQWTVPTIWQSVKPGDRLYVKERHVFETPIMAIGQRIFYEADEPGNRMSKWRAALFMKRENSRLTLLVTATKMERVQEIGRSDAIAEGLRLASNDIEEFFRWPEPLDAQLWLSPVAAYRSLWQSLHTKPGDRWDDNPEVVAITATPHLCNIDQMEAAA